jgi:hypothetical protein
MAMFEAAQSLKKEAKEPMTNIRKKEARWGLFFLSPG